MLLFYTILLQTFVIFLLIGSVFAIGVGAGLATRPDAMARFFERMNGWVSTRHVMRPMEIQRDIEPTLFKWRRPVGVVLLLASAFGLFGLFRYDVNLIVSVLVGKSAGIGTAIIFDTVKWVLALGNVCGIVVGVLLFQFPDVLMKLNAVMSRWVSTRQPTRPMYKMHMTLDNWVMAKPKIAGTIIIVLGFCGALGLGIFILGHHWR
jgi:hypothetical protein